MDKPPAGLGGNIAHILKLFFDDQTYHPYEATVENDDSCTIVYSLQRSDQYRSGQEITINRRVNGVKCLGMVEGGSVDKKVMIINMIAEENEKMKKEAVQKNCA